MKYEAHLTNLSSDNILSALQETQQNNATMLKLKKKKEKKTTIEMI